MKLEIINEKAPMEIDFKKTNPSGSDIRVGELKLKLSQVDENGSPVTDGKTQEIAFDLSKKTDGLYYDPLKLVFQDINTWPQGYYEIIESQAPPGYIKTDNRYIIQLDWVNYTIYLVKVLDKDGNNVNYQGEQLLPPEGVKLYPRGGTSSTGLSQPLFIVNNPASYPSTGGSGTRAFTVIGTVLMAFGLVKAVKKRRDPLLE